MKKNHEGNKRRVFLRTGLLGAAAFTIIPRGLSSRVDDCDTTTVDLFRTGPFPSRSAPERRVLAAPEEPGERLRLTGTVYANDCMSPLSNVVLDIWHADNDGCYSEQEHINMNCKNPSGDDANLRGIIRTDSKGMFVLETIKPGYYLNGAQYRPSHIHLIVRYPGIADLETQLYFEGDPYIESDAAASHPDAAGRIIRLGESDNVKHGIFDIVLNVEPPSSVDEETSRQGTRLRQNHPNPFTHTTRVPLYLARPENVTLKVYDLHGRSISTLLDRQMTEGTHVVDWSGTDDKGKQVDAGTYFCRLSAGDAEQTRIMTKV